MTPELTALTLAALLQVVQYVLMSVPANLELGAGKTMSARDREPSRRMSTPTTTGGSSSSAAGSSVGVSARARTSRSSPDRVVSSLTNPLRTATRSIASRRTPRSGPTSTNRIRASRWFSFLPI